MKEIIVTRNIQSGNAWYEQYTIPGWGNPAAEIYDIVAGGYLALCNTKSTGYRRKLFKTVKTANAWIEKELKREFPCANLVIQIAL